MSFREPFISSLSLRFSFRCPTSSCVKSKKSAAGTGKNKNSPLQVSFALESILVLNRYTNITIRNTVIKSAKIGNLVAYSEIPSTSPTCINISRMKKPTRLNRSFFSPCFLLGMSLIRLGDSFILSIHFPLYFSLFLLFSL